MCLSLTRKCHFTKGYDHFGISTDLSAGHTSHDNVMQTFTPAAIQSADGMPPLVVLSQPPMIAPKSKRTAAANLRFRFQLSFSPTNSFSSFPKSQYTLVKTVVGISLSPSCLAVTLCMPAWKLSIGRGTRVMNGSLPSPTIPGTTPPWTRAAAVTINTVCRKNDEASVRRFSGDKKPVVLEQKKLPTKKKTMARRACNHARGCPAGCCDAPRPKMTVFPTEIS